MTPLRTLFMGAALMLAAGCTTLKTPTFADDGGAIRGYDPVAYFTQGEPVPGDAAHSTIYNDATWHFSSAENLALFEADPARYAPQYGGYCAYAMSNGWVVSTDPEAWHIEDDKLYLNYSLGVRKTWLKDVPGYIEKGDGHWQEKVASQNFE